MSKYLARYDTVRHGITADKSTVKSVYNIIVLNCLVRSRFLKKKSVKNQPKSQLITIFNGLFLLKTNLKVG